MEFEKNFVKELGEFRIDINENISRKFTEFFRENKENEKNLRESTQSFLKDTDSKIRDNLETMRRALNEKFGELSSVTREKLDNISDRVDKRLEKWFEKTNETFAKIMERMGKIDQAQKTIENLSGEVVSLQNTLSDSKSRGIFGEVQLDNIMANIFGKDNNKLYEMQYYFDDTGVLVDCVVKTPQWLISIDSKFSLTNYQKMLDDNLDKEQRSQAKKAFRDWLKKQIDDISEKYIVEGKTIDTALMFMPAEAIFAQVHTYHYDLVEYAYKKKVNLVSPTTIMAMLTIVLISIKSLETQKQAKIIQEELWKLSKEFGRFSQRWWKFTSNFKRVGQDIEGIDITNSKIIQKFDNIENLEFEEKVSIDN